MNDEIILNKMFELSNIDKDQYDKLIKDYNENIKRFLIRYISIQGINEMNMFSDYYFKSIPIIKLIDKYKFSRQEIRNKLNKIMNIELYLSLSKTNLILDDPLYEYKEFDELLYKQIGLRYEPIRISVNKMYGLFETKKDEEVLIVLNAAMKNDKSKTKTLIIGQNANITKDADLSKIAEEILNSNSNVKINDVLEIKKYLDNIDVYVHPKKYKELYQNIAESGFMTGDNTYISKTKAMLSFEWSIYHGSQQINKETNLTLYKAIKNKFEV